MYSKLDESLAHSLNFLLELAMQLRTYIFFTGRGVNEMQV